MDEAEYAERARGLAERVEQYHALRLIYLVSFPFPEWQTAWGTELQYGVVVSRATGRVMSSGRDWMEGQHIDEIKKYVWSYRGRIQCYDDGDLQMEEDEVGVSQRLPIKRMTLRLIRAQ
jgi:hypothetical protein